MKKALVVAVLILLVTVSFLAGRWFQKKNIVSGSSVRKVLYYADPMNPGVKSDKPGTAPCGMPLEPVYEDGAANTAGMRAGTVSVSAEQQQLIGVKVATVVKSSWSHAVRVLGRVVPDESRIYRINSATDGWVKSVSPATTGSLVAKDDMLASFYSPDFFPAIKAYLYGLRSLTRFQSNEKETQAQIEVTNANIESFKVSLRNLGMSEHQIDELARTRESADNIEIRSPHTGFITVRNIYLGQRFERGAELFRIADLSRVWILADVFENESEYFKPGAVARVFLPNMNKTIMARVSSVLPQFDPTSRTLKLRLEADNPGFLLRPDMFVDVELPVDFPSTVSVPLDAVRYSGVRKTVYIDRGNGFFEPRDVETGWRFSDRVQIVRGLAPGERIVVSGNFLIDSESRMRAAAAGISGTVQKDVVCGMDVDEDKAAAAGRASELSGRQFYFCSDRCKQQFDANPARYLKKPQDAGMAAPNRQTISASSVHKDAVCGMNVEEAPATAAGRTSEYRGKKYYFCSDSCKQLFDKDPDHYAEKLKETRLDTAPVREARND